MGVRVALTERIKRAAEQAQQLREKGIQIAGRVVSQGQEGIKELRQAGERLTPVLRSVVSDGSAAVREWMDEANQFLADRAVPPYRKARVAQKRLEEKIQAVAEKVRSTRKANTEAETPAEPLPVSDTEKAEQQQEVVSPARQPDVKSSESARTQGEPAKKRGKGASSGRVAKPKKTTQSRMKPRPQGKATKKTATKAAKVISRV